MFFHPRSPATTPLPWPWPMPPACASPCARAGMRRDSRRPISPGACSTTAARDHAAAGFDAGALYELTYTAQGSRRCSAWASPRCATSASFLRHEGGARQPARRPGPPRRTCSACRKAGAIVRDFLYLGFNEDTAGRRVFDGMMPHIAGARRLFGNSRFAQPGRAPGHPHGRRLAGRRLSLHLCRHDRPGERRAGQPDAALPRHQHVPQGDADRHRARVLAVARLAARDRSRGPRPRPARGRARLYDHRHAALLGARRRGAQGRRLRAADQSTACRGADARAAQRRSTPG